MTSIGHSKPLSHYLRRTRKKLDWFADKLGIQKQEDWYSFTVGDLQRIKKSYFLDRYENGSLCSTLQALYPEFDWNPFLFNNVPRRYWFVKDNQTKLFDWIGEVLEVQKFEDWYKVTVKDIQSLGYGSLLTEFYKGSLFSALQNVYPQYDWNFVHCVSPPHNYSIKMDPRLIQQSLQDALRDIEVGKTSSRLVNRVSKHFGGVLSTLHKFFPDRDWSAFYRSKSENYLEGTLLPFVSKVEKERMIQGYSLDFYLPHLSLAFEFQGRQHYHQYYHGSLADQQERDSRKRQALQQLGIALIEVPYWWNGNVNSLVATIMKQTQHVGYKNIHRSLR